MVKAIANMLRKADVVAPVDVLIEMGLISKTNYDAWRHGRIPYLERVFEGNLSKAGRILRIIGFHVHDLNMRPSQTVYRQWGKGKNRILQFSKSGIKKLEEAYSRHYIWNQSPEKKQAIIKQTESVQMRVGDGEDHGP